MSKVITVAQLNKYVAALLERDTNLKAVQVCGEVSGFKSYASGHLYFTLKDEQASVSCVMFRGQAQSLRFQPENGMKVVMTAKASLYDRDGKFQLYVQTMSPEGLGELYLAYEQLKSKLESEGLFALEHKKKIPVLPKIIGVATSQSGAVIRDIINVLSRRFPGFCLQLIPTAVQGPQAAGQIAEAISTFNRLNAVDVIIVGRGGGSMEDLWAFNEEIVARAVFESNIPVISAVGHETDFTICDFVADLRAPTPSAAAELAIPIKSELFMNLSQKREKMKIALHRKLEYQRVKLNNLIDRPVMRSPYEQINRRREYIDRLSDKLISAENRYKTDAQNKLGLLAAKLDMLSPLKVLARGYSVVSNQDHPAITSVDQVRIDDKINVMLQDGSLECLIKNINDRRMLL
ncbi:MAG: exodeoxyribonuclease VII large subunit [Clostridiaceae bacterium]|nr:exodeoxyribonuclease VII large subunit [Clostridiaceae bacterium]